MTKLDETFAEYATLAIAHLNGEHADELVLIARAHAERDDIVEAQMVALDRYRFALRLTTRDGVEPLDVEFDRPINDLGEMRTKSIELVREARLKLGITELTAAEHEDAEIRSVPTHLTSVVRVERISPHFREITFGGGDLTSFRSAGPDQFVYLLAPQRGCDRLVIDRSFSWDDYERIPQAERPIGAYYTVRRWRPDVAELDMWFLDHGDDGEASSWSGRAKPGDPVALWGPRVAWHPPATTDRYLLVADETGLPAVAVLLEQRPPGLPADVFVELSDPADQLDIAASDDDVAITWLERGDAPTGTTSLLADAVRAMPWPGGNVYAWGGGESRAVTAVRKYLRTEVGLPRESVSMTGYWRHALDTSHDVDDD